MISNSLKQLADCKVRVVDSGSIGSVAAIAATLAGARRIGIRDLPVSHPRERRRRAGAILEMPS